MVYFKETSFLTGFRPVSFVFLATRKKKIYDEEDDNREKRKICD